MKTIRLVIPLAVGLLSVATLSWALIPHPQGAPMTMTVQGKLTGTGGTPIAPGDYTFEFSLFDASVGGTAIWPVITPTEQHLISLQADGLWTAYLGQDYPIHRDLADDTARWLEVAVTPPVGAREVFDRVKFASAPFALEAAQLNGKTGLEYLAQDGDTVGGILAFDLGDDGTLDAEFELLGTAANLVFYDEGLMLTKLWGWDWGELELEDNDGDRTVDLTATGGAGGNLYLYKEDGSHGARMTGGTTAGGSYMVLYDLGGSPKIILEPDQDNDAGAAVPLNSISALEESQEPGVASHVLTSTVNLDGTLQILLARTITVPADGYVLAMGTCTADIEHANGTADLAVFGINDQSGSLPLSQYFYVQLDDAPSTGYYQQVVSVHGLYEVNSGATTFYFLGKEYSGTVKVYERQLSLVYFPTQYGAVTVPASASGEGIVERGAVTAPAITAQDIAAEQAEAEQFNAARLARELETLRIQVQALTEKLDQEAAASRRNEGDR